MSQVRRPADMVSPDAAGRTSALADAKCNLDEPMRQLLLATVCGLLAVISVAGPVGARDFGAVYVDDAMYRVFGNAANVPDGTGTDPFATFTNSTNADQLGVAQFAPGSPTGHHGGRWAVYRATWTGSGDPATLVTSWSSLQAYVASGQLALVRDAPADFRCPVLGNPGPIN
jgi:hypothetical protein